MARSLGLRTVAEGVETMEQRDWLIEHGVDYAQGFLYSRPLSAEDFVRFVQTGVSA
jgi:sensor c-di-GMP phosphodiesterase-like protein